MFLLQKTRILDYLRPHLSKHLRPAPDGAGLRPHLPYGLEIFSRATILIMFTVIPAIDILNGKCVRLTKGVYTDSTTYSEDPLAMAEKWQKSGAKKIHIVDLDGAKTGQPVNNKLIKEIAKKIKCPIEVGGGIRSIQNIEEYLKAGVSQVILGSAIFKDEQLLKTALKRYKQQIIGGIDLKEGQVKIAGWLENTGQDGLAVIKKLQELGLATIICTDIAKDGLLSGPNLKLYKNISRAENINIIASGGITSLEDIQEVKKIKNVVGCIIGKALYENKLDLAEALKYNA